MVQNHGNPSKEIEIFSSGKYFHTVQIDTETYLAYLRQIFIEKGAQKQVADDFSIII